MERKMPFIMSLKNNHGVCCRKEYKNVRLQTNMNFTTDKLINISKKEIFNQVKGS